MFLAHLETTDATGPKAGFERRPPGLDSPIAKRPHTVGVGTTDPLAHEGNTAAGCGTRSRSYCSAGLSSVRYIAVTWAYPDEEYFRLSQLLR